MGLLEDFSEAYNLSRDRILLAKQRDISSKELWNYVARRENFMERNINWSRCISQVLGYACGNYSTFCMTQEKLNLFDKRIENGGFELQI